MALCINSSLFDLAEGQGGPSDLGFRLTSLCSDSLPHLIDVTLFPGSWSLLCSAGNVKETTDLSNCRHLVNFKLYSVTFSTNH